jgi:hypothetical protein
MDDQGASDGKSDAKASKTPQTHVLRCSRYAQCMTVRDMLTALQTLPRDAELLAFEAGCEFSPGESGSTPWSDSVSAAQCA